MGLFGFLSMGNDRADREVANFQKDRLVIDTCGVTDSSKPFETGIKHPFYDDGRWVIVQLYNTKALAIKGHEKWTKLMTAKKLPKELKDVSTSETAKMVDNVTTRENWRIKRKEVKK